VKAVVIDLLSWALIASGAFFTVTGMIGLVRMPDLFTRLHAASVTDTLGAGLLCGGLILQAGPTLVAAKLVFILALLFFTGPAITHALAQAALHAGMKPLLDEDRRDRSLDIETEQAGGRTSLAPAAQ
jgi:multicomponent Na+:H+ antiporter subunit G